MCSKKLTLPTILFIRDKILCLQTYLMGQKKRLFSGGYDGSRLFIVCVLLVLHQTATWTRKVAVAQIAHRIPRSLNVHAEQKKQSPMQS